MRYLTSEKRTKFFVEKPSLSSTGTEEIVISSVGRKSGVCTFTVSIMSHYRLEECTIGHARLMGLAKPVDFLNPHNAMHDDHT